MLQSFKSLSIIKPHIFLFSLLNFNVHIEFFFYTDKLSKILIDHFYFAVLVMK